MLLVDPQAFGNWVVAARRIRAVDPEWPRPGTRFHHSVGLGPIAVRDSSEVRRLELNRLLELEVRFRPGGVALVTITLVPIGRGLTRVHLDEAPVSGIVRWAWNRGLAFVFRLRNDASLRRVRRLVGSHATVAHYEDLLPDMAAVGGAVAIEEFDYEVAPDQIDAWVERDARAWTPVLAQRRGFLGKQVWRHGEHENRLLVHVWWSGDEGQAPDGRRLDAAEQAAVDAAMGEFRQPLVGRRDHHLLRTGTDAS